MFDEDESGKVLVRPLRNSSMQVCDEGPAAERRSLALHFWFLYTAGSLGRLGNACLNYCFPEVTAEGLTF